jgi:hypothetical protein
MLCSSQVLLIIIYILKLVMHDVHQENVLVVFHGKCHFAYNKK